MAGLIFLTMAIFLLVGCKDDSETPGEPLEDSHKFDYNNNGDLFPKEPADDPVPPRTD